MRAAATTPGVFHQEWADYRHYQMVDHITAIEPNRTTLSLVHDVSLHPSVS